MDVPILPEGLEIWTVYFNPKDFPGKYVVRRWVNDSPTDEVYAEDTLLAVRCHVPEGLLQLPAQSGDDPAIVETWF